ncbi:MAG: DUF3352 domain-containing protein [Bacteroidota bacterium]
MWKKVLIGIVAAALVAGGIYWFTYTKELRTPVSDAINAIPSNAAIIFESKQTNNSWRKLSQNNVMWEGLLSVKTFSKINIQARYIDSLLNSEPAVSKMLDNRSLFISAHVSGANTFDFLYTFSVPNLTQQPLVEAFLKSINNNLEPGSRVYDGVKIATIYPKHDSLSYAVTNGIVIISSQPTLVEDAIRQLSSGVSLAADKNFSRVINTAGKNVDGNVYILYKNFPSVLNHFISPEYKKETNSLAGFADCSGWDVTIKPNALLLSGFTQANDSSVNFLNVFQGQKPQEIELTKIVPSKTALLLFFGISNMKMFHRNYKRYLSAVQQGKAQSYERFVENMDKTYAINIEQVMLEWMQSEMALVVTEPSSVDFTNNSYAVIRSSNVEETWNTLTGLSDSICKKDKIKREITEYRNHIITRLNINQLLPQLLGSQFNRITNTYFTAIEDYIVFGNDTESLQRFINDFENNKTWANDKNYKIFSDNISNEVNIYLYSSVARSSDIYSNMVTSELAKEIEINLELFHKLEAFGVQFTTNENNKLFYSNAYLKYNPKYRQESGTLWESKLDTTVSSQPNIVINHNTKVKEIVVQDDANKLYLISNTGKIIWSKQLSGKIIGSVVQIDALKNGKLQMLFNTGSAIFLLDRNGNDMRGFPVKLESAATNAVSVFDYEKNREYRIFVACENKKIRCFKPSGEEVTAFKFGKANYLLRLPLQYVNVDGKDHIVGVDEKGGIYVFNRQGEVKVKIKEMLPKGIKDYYLEIGKDYSKSFIVGADTLGNVIKISFEGKKEIIKVHNVQASSSFMYKDLNNDKMNEYIFLFENELQVFSQNKSQLFNYEFKEGASQVPLFFISPDGTGKIGVLSEKTNEIYLFNNSGSLCKGFPLSGKTLFSISDLNNDGIYNIITGSADNSIYVYHLE